MIQHNRHNMTSLCSYILLIYRYEPKIQKTRREGAKCRMFYKYCALETPVVFIRKCNICKYKSEQVVVA